MSKRFAGLERELLYTSASCVVASSVSFASAQVRKLTHAAVPPFPTKLCFAGTPEQADFALCANPDFVRGRTKSACPAAAKSACLPFHPAPFSVSGKQRYNTLDFPGKVVCQETAGFFGFFRSKGKLSPLNTPGKGGTPFPSVHPRPTGLLPPLLDDPGPKGLPLCNPLNVQAVAIHFENLPLPLPCPNIKNRHRDLTGNVQIFVPVLISGGCVKHKRNTWYWWEILY